MGYPASKLDGRVFYDDAPFLKDAPTLQTYVANPNNIGCHTFGTSEKAFYGTQEIEREVQRLKSKYEDFNINEVVTSALRLNSTDLEGTYKQIAFDKMMAKAELERQAREVQQQKENSLLESKRQASVVSGGSSATASTTSESFEPITSVAEAWAAAKRSMGAK